MKVKLTLEGFKKTNKPTIKYDTIAIDISTGLVKFIQKGVIIGTVGANTEFRYGDTLTITDLFGKFEVTLD